MNILGIVAEYDPFHSGHLRHISEAKKAVSPDLTYVVLSPCFKQRGDLSLLSPADRARLALEAGADAVFCLPVLWTVRDAEHYALGAVSLLSGLGTTHLAFGAETADLPLLMRTADMLEDPEPSFRTALKAALSEGVGYPAALSDALTASLPQSSGLLSRPNNTLAVCYLRALRRLGLKISPVVVERRGSYHAKEIDPLSPSASALRDSLMRGNYDPAYMAVPGFTAGILRRRFLAGTIPDDRVADALLLSRLRSMNMESLRCLPDLSEGMENALAAAAVSACSRKELIGKLTTRRYPAARISRLCAGVMLGLTQEMTDHAPLPQNALLLGLRKNPEMTAGWKDLQIPVIPSFAEWKESAHPSDLSAWHIWAMCCRLPDTLPFSEKIVTV